MTRSPAAAEQLIQNLTQSNSTKQCDEERARAGGANPQDINEIRSSLSSIQNMLKKKVSFVEEVEELGNDEEEDCNFVSGSGFQNQRPGFQGSRNFSGSGFQRNNFRNSEGNQSNFGSNQFQKAGQNSGYTRTYGANEYQEPAPMKNDDIQGMFKQLLEGQEQLTGAMNGKIDSLYNEFNSKFDAIHIHLKKLDTQMAQTAEAVKRQVNHLPGRTEQNPREHCNAVMTRSRKCHPTTIAEDPISKDLIELEVVDEDEEIAENAEFFRGHNSQKGTSIDTPSGVDRHRVSELVQKFQRGLSIDTPKPVDRHSAPKKVQKSQKSVSIDMDLYVDRHDGTERNSQKGLSIDTTEPVDRHNRSNQTPQKPVSIDTTEPVDRHDPDRSLNTPVSKPRDPVPVYIPKVPYPKPSRKEIEDAKCKEVMDKLRVQIPFFDACQMAPVLRKNVQKMASREIGFDEGIAMIENTCIKMIKEKMPKKLEDPGSFVLSISIMNQTFGRSLCDIGSGVNLMPYSVAKKLGMIDFTDTSTVLVLADRSVRIPKGILEDVPVRIGQAWIPTDFIVLDYDHNEPKDPLILGRSFLATAGALIDCRGGSIELRLDCMTLKFDMDKTSKKPTIDGQTFMVETLDVVDDKVVGELDVKDVLEVVSKEEGECVITDKQVTSLRVAKQKTIVQPKLAKKSAAPSTAIKQKAPKITLPTPPLKQRYAHPKPSSKTPSIINNSLKGAESVSHLRKPRDYRRKLGFSIDDIAGKRSLPPKQRTHPGDIPRFLGRSHAPNAYTPPWMRRLAKKHSMPLSDPPDA